MIEATDAEVISDELIACCGAVASWFISGGYAHREGKSMAHGYVMKNIAKFNSRWSVEFLGQYLPERCQKISLFDNNVSQVWS